MDIQGGIHSKPRLLILTQKHDTCCHRMLESRRLGNQYQVECALKGKYDFNMNEFAAVILYDLTNDMLVQIVSGTANTPYSGLAVQAILKGKKVFAVEEEVELFDYKRTAPAVYYNMMLDKVNFLKDSGVVLCSANQLEDIVLGEKINPEPASVSQNEQPVKQEKIKRAIITARDLAMLNAVKTSVLRIAADSIVSSEAWDYARVHGMQIIRE
nr:hypothetical protein [uncultured Caproiciproducens sp.]